MTPAFPCPYGNGQLQGLSNEPLVEVRGNKLAGGGASTAEGGHGHGRAVVVVVVLCRLCHHSHVRVVLLVVRLGKKDEIFAAF